MNADNPFQPPQYARSIPAKRRKAATMDSSEGMWRKGKTLITHRYPEFPDTCIKCGQPASGYRKKVKLARHHPAVFLLVLLGLLIYVIVALVVRKKAVVEVGLCPEHRGKLKQFWNGGLFSIAIALATLVFADSPNRGPSVLLAMLLILLGVTSLLASRSLSASRITDDQLWLQGAGEPFLQDLPEYPNK